MSSDRGRINLHRQEKAQKVLSNLGVKLQIFKPSGRELWTVVGTDGDFIVDYEPSARRPPYCSCQDFHFRVLSGAVSECYHLIAIKQARAQQLHSTVIFADEEYEGFLRALLQDVFSRIL
jgi:predicted nucleic acid-binding Zn finger protein